MLRSQGKYAIAQNDSTGQLYPRRFKKTYGHYKWDALRRFSMPKNAELLLWVLPTCCLFKHDRYNILLGLSEFSKTVVFAHYAMTTRAVAALTSMEAQIRLLKTIGDRKVIDDNDIDNMYADTLLKPFEKLLQNQSQKKEELTDAIKKFFKQEYARRVLTAWSIRRKRKLSDIYILRDYCKAAYWDEMWAEYLEIIDKGDPEKTIDACIDVLYWGGENQKFKDKNYSQKSFTKVFVMPDWSKKQYECSYGERYTEFSNETKLNSNRPEDIRKRFLSPFYPFVLAATEVAKEGVDLHNYSAKIMHWAAPKTLSAYVQEEGRIDRRMSITSRRNIAAAYHNIPKLKQTDSIKEMALRLKIYYAVKYKVDRSVIVSGLFPEWYLDEAKYKIERVHCHMPLSREVKYYGKLKNALKQYRSFGIEGKDDNSLKFLCPYIVSK